MNDALEPSPDIYTTLSAPGTSTLKVQGSKFLSFAYPVDSADGAIEAWKALQREYHDATHHCFAYRLKPPRSEFRTQDDGEPAGTAGKPILAAIDHAGLTGVVVVVVRYFGGTKLGVGGLSRAYGEAAARAIQAGATVERFMTEVVRVTHSHHLTSPVMRAIEMTGARIIESTYDDEVHLRLTVRATQVRRLIDSLIEATNGGVAVERLPEP